MHYCSSFYPIVFTVSSFYVRTVLGFYLTCSTILQSVPTKNHIKSLHYTFIICSTNFDDIDLYLNK